MVLPKFKIESDVKLSDHLTKMGIIDLFHSNQADLSAIDGGRGQRLYVSKMLQKSFIEVNEHGTEASAASAASIDVRVGGGPKPFIADHPFIFVIHDSEWNAILFMGRFAEPVVAADQGTEPGEQ